MRANKRFLSAVLLIAALFLMLAVCEALSQEDCHAAIPAAVKKKARAYQKKVNKIFKVNGAKYCFRNRKVRTGQRKVGSYYYFFNKSNGKMMKNTGVKLGTKIFFFKANGRKYKYGYKPTGTAKGNAAAGVIISAAGLQPKAEPTNAQLKAAYNKITSRTSYGIVENPNLGSRAWIAKYAYTAAIKKQGKCYNLAALTYLTYKALGAKPKLQVGKCNRKPDPSKTDAENKKAAGEHAWVTIAGNNTLIYDSIFDLGNATPQFFGKKFSPDKKTDAYKVQGKDYLYYLNKTF